MYVCLVDYVAHLVPLMSAVRCANRRDSPTVYCYHADSWDLQRQDAAVQHSSASSRDMSLASPTVVHHVTQAAFSMANLLPPPCKTCSYA